MRVVRGFLKRFPYSQPSVSWLSETGRGRRQYGAIYRERKAHKVSAEPRKGSGEGREKNENESQHEREKRRKSYRQLANKTRTNRPVGRTFTDYSLYAQVQRFPSGNTPASLSTSSLAPAFLWEKELGKSF